MENSNMSPLSTVTRRLVSLVAVSLATLSLTVAAQMAAPQEGKEYLRLKNPQPVESGKKIEVIEFFSYGCPHCGEFEPILQGWLKSAPADVQFRRVPVMFQDRWVPLAKIYYTLDALGEESRLSPDVFVALHGKGMALWQDKTFFDWAASQGLDRKKVEDMYNSFAISGKVNRARMIAQAYQVQSVPLIVVDGKFVSNRVPSHAAMPPLIDALVAKARAERPKT
jgi:protein dithiol oxidoreductase (disulfide-forming)